MDGAGGFHPSELRYCKRTHHRAARNCANLQRLTISLLTTLFFRIQTPSDLLKADRSNVQLFD